MSTPSRHLGALVLAAILWQGNPAHAQDPNFHIYLGFGQSNMEGITREFSAEDLVPEPRFRLLPTLTCPELGRTRGVWTTATAPVVRCNSGLTPLDHFARTLLDSLPSTITIGIVPVAIAGAKLEAFDRDAYQAYFSGEGSSLSGVAAEYDGNPYAHLVKHAKQAKRSGIIKGILMHQGESNLGDTTWTRRVRKIYLDLLLDLALDSNQVPLLAGEVVGTDQGGSAAAHNKVIATLPQVITTSHVVSSLGCTALPDNMHFDSPGVRELGRRYARTMLPLLRAPTTSTREDRRTDRSGRMLLTLVDLNGKFVSRIAPDADASHSARNDRTWNDIRREIPSGIYLLEDNESGHSRKVVNGR